MTGEKYLKKTQWPKVNGHNDKQLSTKHTHKAKDRVTQTPLKTGGELRCSGRVSSSCSTSGPRRVNLITKPEMYCITEGICRGRQYELC